MEKEKECVIHNDEELEETKRDLKNQFKFLRLSRKMMQEALEKNDNDEYELWLDDYYFNKGWINSMKNAIKKYEEAKK